MKQERFSKRTIKKILAVGFILSCTLQFSGCGSKENTESKQEMQNDTIYFLSGEEYGENGEYRWKAYSLKTGLEETTPTPLLITLEAGESIEHLCVDQKGDAFAVVNQDTKLGGNSSQKMYFLNRYTADGNIQKNLWKSAGAWQVFCRCFGPYHFDDRKGQGLSI